MFDIKSSLMEKYLKSKIEFFKSLDGEDNQKLAEKRLRF